MRNVLPELLGWWQAGEDVAVATVIAARQSAPLQPGTSMLVGPDRSVVGSVSGGCVEADVYAIADQVLADGRPILQTYGISDEDAFGVGLTCGGSIDIFVQKVNQATFPELGQVARAVTEQRPIAVATVVRHPDRERIGQRLVLDAGTPGGTLGDHRIDAAVRADGQELLDAGRSQVLCYGPDGQPGGDAVQVFVESCAPQPRLLVFGANDFAVALAELGTSLGYRATVCDARPLFATRARFPNIDDLVVDWPHRYLETEIQAGRVDGRTAICVLTHDPKFDLPLLKTALTMPIHCYVGAIGSRRTDQDRRKLLAEQGLTPGQLRRLSSPIGLDLGARTPQQTAVSILAEIIATQTGSSGGRLTDGSGPIHHETATDDQTAAGKRRSAACAPSQRS